MIAEVSPAAFYNAVNFARQTLRQPLALNLTLHPEHHYQNARCFHDSARRAGFAVLDGELINVFSQAKSWGDCLVTAGVALGAKRLDCFDGYLPTLYQKHGFIEVDRAAWDDAYAPPGWRKDLWGTPDVVFMKLPGA